MVDKLISNVVLELVSQALVVWEKAECENLLCNGSGCPYEACILSVIKMLLTTVKEALT